MRLRLKPLLIILTAYGAGVSSVHAAGKIFEIDAASWQQPRSAEMVKALPAIRAATQVLVNSTGDQLVIRHRDDEEGALWGAELRDWMISLGVKPASIRLEVMALTSAALQIEVTESSRGTR